MKVQSYCKNGKGRRISFNGTFEGNGHTITVNISSENDSAALFGLSGGECSNLAILTTDRQKIDTVVHSSSSDKPGWIAVSSLFGQTGVTVSQVSQSGASFYGSMLSGGNIIAIICVALLIASGTVAIIIFKRKKSMVNAADSTSDGSPD